MCWREEAHLRDFANRGFPRQASSRRKGLLRWCTDAPVARLTARRRRAYGRLIPNSHRLSKRPIPPRPSKSRRDASYASLGELCDAAKPALVQAGMPSLSSRINVKLAWCTELAALRKRPQQCCASLSTPQTNAQCIACCSPRDWLQKEAQSWQHASPCSSRTSPSPPRV